MPIVLRGPMPAKAETGLRVPQARVLQALMPADPTAHPMDWPVLTRAHLVSRCGYSPTNSINRILNSTSDTNPGLVKRGLVEVITVVVEDRAESNYRITAVGFEQCVAVGDAVVPPG